MIPFHSQRANHFSLRSLQNNPPYIIGYKLDSDDDNYDTNCNEADNMIIHTFIVQVECKPDARSR